MNESSKTNSSDRDAEWTEEELSRLRKFLKSPPSVIIRKFKNHSIASIDANFQRLWSENPNRNQTGSHWWLRDEDALIKKHFETSGIEFLTRLMRGRTEAEICARAAMLKVDVVPESTNDCLFLLQELADNGRWNDVMIITRDGINATSRKTKSSQHHLTTQEVNRWFYNQIMMRDRKPLERRVRIVRREQHSLLSTIDTVLAPHAEKLTPSPGSASA